MLDEVRRKTILIVQFKQEIFQEISSGWSPVSSPDLLARVERMVGVNQGDRVRLIIRREREDTGLAIADIGKYF